ncbi:SAM-dependent methyltransferase [Litorimonas sp. RW-G-Af-16]|uniref:SAM-dependent methyltransferase n=1 Tax=Litorimonas sp. RW-G-Af-16 TaxID=3241168 RepID=UPI00390CBF38
MADPTAIPQIFDDTLRHMRRARARRRMAQSGLSFFLTRCIEDVAERLQDVTQRFETMVIIGPFDVSEALAAMIPADKKPDHIHYAKTMSDAPECDAIISLLALQSENDLPGLMTQMATKLRPNGLMITAIFGGDTLTELRQTLYKTDDELLGGLTARVYPMITHSQAAPLLTRAGLNLPVVDMDRFTVRYSGLSRLINDLRDIGETNTLQSRSANFVGRDYLTALTQNYAEMFAEEGKLPASFEILWLTGWKPHESQQKPLKPGSAKMRLADALNTRETKL